MASILNEFAGSIADIAIILFVLIFALIRARAGLAHRIAVVIALVLAIALGFLGSEWLTPKVSGFVWEKWRPTVEEKLQIQLKDTDYGLGTDSDGAVKIEKQGSSDSQENGELGESSEHAGILVEAWEKISEAFGIDGLKDFKDLKYAGGDVREEITEKLAAVVMAKVRLMVEKIVSIALFAVITILAFAILKRIVRPLKKTGKVPVIGWFDHFGGFVLGVIEAVVLLLIVVRGAGLLHITYFSELSKDSMLLSWFVGGDIQGTIDSIKNITVEDLKKLNIEDIKKIDVKGLGITLKELFRSGAGRISDLIFR